MVYEKEWPLNVSFCNVGCIDGICHEYFEEHNCFVPNFMNLQGGGAHDGDDS